MDEYIEKIQQLLLVEHETEVVELQNQIRSQSPAQCEVLGLSILNLDIESISTALFGRIAVDLRSMNGKILPSSFKVGDEVQLLGSTKTSHILSHSKSADKETSSDGAQMINGIITKATGMSIVVTIEMSEEVDQLTPPIRLNRRASDVTYKKLCSSLQHILTRRDHPLVQLLFNDTNSVLSLPERVPMRLQKGQTTTLNPSQIRAIESSLSPSSLVSLIHGPPGTGKTATLAELIVQAVKSGQKVLVSAPSNAAVDNLLERLLVQEGASGVSCIRLGHPARMDPKLLEYCLDSQMAECDGREIVDDIKKEIDDLHRKPLKKFEPKDFSDKTSTPSATVGKKMSRKEKYMQIKVLRKDLKKYEKKMVEDLLKTRDVVFATCVGASSSLLRNSVFDLVIVDEAAQALEVETWIPAIHGKRLVLAGDPNQLPPTIKSHEAMTKGLSISLLERLMSPKYRFRYQNVIYLLDTQYRMHKTICDWASNAMYQSKLQSHDSAASRSLNNWMPSLSHEMTDDMTETYAVLTLIDTSGCDFEEMSTITGSRYNEIEAEVVRRYVTLLIKAGAKASDIGIISPYNGQVTFLRSLFATKSSDYPNELEYISIRTVDGFQGGEKEIIILSMVRSNESGEVGFLSDKRRINVAVTRARRHLAIIGDVTTCQENEFMRELLEYMSLRGDHRSAMELLSTDWMNTNLIYEPYVPDNEPIAGNPSTDGDATSLSTSTSHKLRAISKKQTKKSHVKSDSSGSKISSDTLKDDEFRQNLRDLLEAFATYSPIPLRALGIVHGTVSNQNMLTFSNNLSSFHRKAVHDICEEYPILRHASEGDGSCRYISVIRPTESIQPSPSHSIVSNDKDSHTKGHEIAASTAKNSTVTTKSSQKLSQQTNLAKSKSSGNTIASSSNGMISDDQFISSLHDVLASFSQFLPVPIDSLSNISAMMSGADSLLFSTRIPPNRRKSIVDIASKYLNLSHSTVGIAVQSQVTRSQLVAVMGQDTSDNGSLFKHLDEKEDHTDDNVKDQSSPAISSAKSVGKDMENVKSVLKQKPKQVKESSLVATLRSKEIDEEEALKLAMEEVKAYEKEHQFRVRSSAFPNNEKVQRKKQLHHVLQEASDSRKQKVNPKAKK